MILKGNKWCQRNTLYIINIARRENLDSNFMHRMEKVHEWNIYVCTYTYTYINVYVIPNTEYKSVKIFWSQFNRVEKYGGKGECESTKLRSSWASCEIRISYFEKNGRQKQVKFAHLGCFGYTPEFYYCTNRNFILTCYRAHHRFSWFFEDRYLVFLMFHFLGT